MAKLNHIQAGLNTLSRTVVLLKSEKYPFV